MAVIATAEARKVAALSAIATAGRGQPQQHGAKRRACDDRSLSDRGADGVGALQLVGDDQSRRARRHGRRLDDPRGGRQGGEQRRQHHRHRGGRDDRQCDHRYRPRKVGGDDQPAAIPAVGEHSTDRPQNDERGHARCRGRREPGRRPGAVVDERQQRHVVEPIAARGDREAGQQQVEGTAAREAEVGLGEGGSAHAVSMRVSQGPPHRAAAQSLSHRLPQIQARWVP